MGQKIEILPNDQSWVGKKVRWTGWPAGDYFVIHFVSMGLVIGDTHTASNHIFRGFDYKIEELGNDYYWELYEKPEEFTFSGGSGGSANAHKGSSPGGTNIQLKEECEHEIKEKSKFKFGGQDCPVCHDTYVHLDLHIRAQHPEYQGHHCTGKCTKLPEGMSAQVDPKFTVTNVSGETVITPPAHFTVHMPPKDHLKEKECEHEWSGDWALKPNERYCVKCQKQKVIDEAKEFINKQDPFWLKVGDIVKGVISSHGSPMKIKRIKPEKRICIIERLAAYKDEIEYEFSFESLSSERVKKIKLVSPALIKFPDGSIYPSQKYYSEKPNEIEFCFPGGLGVGIIKEGIDWPARDQFGREIFYEVEE